MKKIIVNVALDDGAYPLERAHPTDAGADIRTPADVEVPAHGSMVIRTGVHVELPGGCAGVIQPKSGLNVKHDILSFGLIDEGYTGEVVVKLYNLGDTPCLLSRGSKVSQLVIQEVAYCGFRVVESIAGGPRADGGFGSTGD